MLALCLHPPEQMHNFSFMLKLRLTTFHILKGTKQLAGTRPEDRATGLLAWEYVSIRALGDITRGTFPNCLLVALTS